MELEIYSYGELFEKVELDNNESTLSVGVFTNSIGGFFDYLLGNYAEMKNNAFSDSQYSVKVYGDDVVSAEKHNFKVYGSLDAEISLTNENDKHREDWDSYTIDMKLEGYANLPNSWRTEKVTMDLYAEVSFEKSVAKEYGDKLKHFQDLQDLEVLNFIFEEIDNNADRFQLDVLHTKMSLPEKLIRQPVEVFIKEG